MVLHPNPDIFHSINEIMIAANKLHNGQNLPGKSPVELEELARIVDGSTDIPFMPKFKGTSNYDFKRLDFFLFVAFFK